MEDKYKEIIYKEIINTEDVPNNRNDNLSFLYYLYHITLIVDNYLIYNIGDYIYFQELNEKKQFYFNINDNTFINCICFFGNKEKYFKLLASYIIHENNKKGGLRMFEIYKKSNNIKSEIIFENFNIFTDYIDKINNSKIIYSNCQENNFAIFNLNTKQIETIINNLSIDIQFFFNNDIPNFDLNYGKFYFSEIEKDNLSKIKEFKLLLKLGLKKKLKEKYVYNLDNKIKNEKIYDNMNKNNEHNFEISIIDNKFRTQKIRITFPKCFICNKFEIISYCNYIANNYFYFLFSIDRRQYNYHLYYLGKINIDDYYGTLQYYYYNNEYDRKTEIKYMNNKIYLIERLDDDFKIKKIVEIDESKFISRLECYCNYDLYY